MDINKKGPHMFIPLEQLPETERFRLRVPVAHRSLLLSDAERNSSNVGGVKFVRRYGAYASNSKLLNAMSYMVISTDLDDWLKNQNIDFSLDLNTDGDVRLHRDGYFEIHRMGKTLGLRIVFRSAAEAMSYELRWL